MAIEFIIMKINNIVLKKFELIISLRFLNKKEMFFIKINDSIATSK